MKYTDVFLKIISIILLSSCAGPTSPFGSIELWSGDGHSFFPPSREAGSEQELTVYPKRQVLHKASDFKIEFNIEDAKDSPLNLPEIKMVYNKVDVTNTFLKAAKLSHGDAKEAQFVFNNLNLKPDRHHQIDLFWRANIRNNFWHLAYLPPVCSMSDRQSLISTDPFKPKLSYIKKIKEVAANQNLNPSLLAGLIAQESGFNPSQVSKAKAIGLTQVTSLADEQIKKYRTGWRSDPRIEALSVDEIKKLIKSREISISQDWRLDPIQAIEGGAVYINYLTAYWNLSENKSLLNASKQYDLTEVILASYNSGAARIKNKIKTNGDDWLNDKELKEAFKYVNSIVSYCYHFSEQQ